MSTTHDDQQPGNKRKKNRAAEHAKLIKSVADPDDVSGSPKTVGDPDVNGARAPPHDNVELWTADTVCAFFGGERALNKATLYRGVADGRVPDR